MSLSSTTVDLSFKFYESETSTKALLASPIVVNQVSVASGFLKVEVPLSASDRQQLFLSQGELWVDVEDLSMNKTYSRKLLSTLPFALRTPVDMSSVGFNNSGQLYLVQPVTAGSRGPSGAPGKTGATGATGASGPQGDPGSKGSAGTVGMSGAPGQIGPTGVNGVDGVRGSTGLQGAEGAAGARGSTGALGMTGNQGSQGPDGVKGIQGPTGDSGASGRTGQAVSLVPREQQAVLEGLVFAVRLDP